MIKTLIKKIIAALLRREAQLILAKYHPKIVAVAGSVGKTSTKDAIVAVLAGKYFVRGSSKSYNSEFGVPLTILNCHTAWNNPLGWGRNLLEGLALIAFKNPYPEWLVLEIGSDRPGDIADLAKWLKFNAVVLTSLPPLPVHVEFFASAEELNAEDFSIVESLIPNGVAVLNADDEIMTALAKKFLGQRISYGFSAEAIVQASNEKILYEEGVKGKKPNGLTFKVDYDGGSYPVRLEGFLGKHQIYPVLAAIALGLSQGLNIVSMVESLRLHEGPPGRLRLISGRDDVLILDDTYNSSPAALAAALQTLGQIETTGRRVAVIGDMLELGLHTVEAHKEAGRLAAGVSDIIATVGLRAKFITEGARAAKFNLKNLHHYHDYQSAIAGLPKIIKSGDVVLIKGSQSVRLEKLVGALMAEPEKKAALLCRQDREWMGS